MQFSAGLGFVKANQDIPSYNLTVSTAGKENYIKSRITEKRFYKGKWWNVLE